MQVRVTELSGVVASLRWGYHSAAALGAWTVTRTEHGWSLTAAVLSTDAFRLSRRPLAFVAPHEKGMWTWPIVGEPQITGAQLSAALGPMEKK